MPVSSELEPTVDPWAALPTVRSADELERYGVPEPRVRDKVEPRVMDVHREWIAASPLVLVATSGRDGSCDVSPKGDPPGFVKCWTSAPWRCPSDRGTGGWTGSTT